MRHLLWCLPLWAAVGCSFGPEPPARSSPSPDETAATPTHRPAGIDAEEKPAPKKNQARKPLDNAAMERLARTDPIAFIEQSIQRYDREVRGYNVTLVKRERIAGTLQPTEQVESIFREKPFSV